MTCTEVENDTLLIRSGEFLAPVFIQELPKKKRLAYVMPVGYGRNVPRTIRVKYKGVCQCRT